MLFEAIQAEFRRLQLHPVNLIDERPGSEMRGEQTCVHDERIKIDAIDYSLSVYQTGPLYHASWACMQCSEQLASKLRGHTQQAALDRATMNVRLHHRAIHRPEPNDKGVRING